MLSFLYKNKQTKASKSIIDILNRQTFTPKFIKVCKHLLKLYIPFFPLEQSTVHYLEYSKLKRRCSLLQVCNWHKRHCSNHQCLFLFPQGYCWGRERREVLCVCLKDCKTEADFRGQEKKGPGHKLT